MQDRGEDRSAPAGESTGRRAESLIADLAKKAVASSVGALLSSEEGIRALVIDKCLAPRWKPATIAELDAAQVEAFFVSPWPAHAHPLRQLA